MINERGVLKMMGMGLSALGFEDLKSGRERLWVGGNGLSS